MPEARDIFGSVFKGGTATLMARVVGRDGEPVRQADLLAAACSVYLLDPHDPDRRTAVEGHAALALPVAELISDTLQTGPPWDVDDVGYNLRHTIDVAGGSPFAHAGRRYLVEFRLHPAAGQPILVRFRLNCV